jgi:hypothetical protein
MLGRLEPDISIVVLQPRQRQQKAMVDQLLEMMLGPFRAIDAEEVRECLACNGGVDRLRLTFFKENDLGNDGVWGIWKLEGPAFSWYFPGSLHVHTWLNIARKAGSQQSAHRACTDGMPLLGELARQRVRALAGPTHWRLGIASGCGIDQRFQCRGQIGIGNRLSSASTSLPTQPLGQRCMTVWPAPQKLVQPIRETPGRLAHGGTYEKAMDRRRDYAVAQGSRPRSS